MVENSASAMFMLRSSGSLVLLILCCSILPSTALTTGLADQGHLEDSEHTNPDIDPTWYPDVIETSNASFTEEAPFNTTEHRGFLHGFVESFSVILVSEIGDKTFFIAAILSMNNNKLTVFLAAISALASMTILSALLGFVVTKFIPREYTYYTCTAIMFLFGLKMLWEAWRMKANEGEETQREVEEELAARHGSSPSLSSRPIDEEEGAKEEEMIDMNPSKEDNVDESDNVVVKEEPKKQRKSLHVQIREKSWFGKKCLKIFKLFTNTFVMTFLAEWGDRSQLATIVMAGINDVSGVCVGGVLGHTLCTSLAVLCGALIAKKVSVRVVTLVGALVFIGFAIASLFIDPYEENHLVPDVDGDDHNSTVFKENQIEFVGSSTTELSI